MGWRSPCTVGRKSCTQRVRIRYLKTGEIAYRFRARAIEQSSPSRYVPVQTRDHHDLARCIVAWRVFSMYDNEFDHLLVRFADQQSRRTSVATLLGGALAALGFGATRDGAAKRKKKCKPPRVRCGKKRCCAFGLSCINGQCVDPRCGQGGTDCDAGLKCVNAACVCDADLCRDATNPNPGSTVCSCELTSAGESLCMADQFCGSPIACGADGSCPDGRVCRPDGCGGNPTCIRLCV